MKTIIILLALLSLTFVTCDNAYTLNGTFRLNIPEEHKLPEELVELWTNEIKFKNSHITDLDLKSWVVESSDSEITGNEVFIRIQLKSKLDPKLESRNIWIKGKFINFNKIHGIINYDDSSFEQVEMKRVEPKIEML